MFHALAPLLLGATLAATAPAKAAPDSVALAALLTDFLAGAGRNDAVVHDRFWADDLIYTGSGGRRVGKATIMNDVRTAPAPAAGDPVTTYGAEDLRIQLYGDAALVAFRLVAKSVKGDSTSVANYLNSGFFVKRQGRWQAVGWQATKQP